MSLSVKLMAYNKPHTHLVSWSLASLFSTITAISDDATYAAPVNNYTTMSECNCSTENRRPVKLASEQRNPEPATEQRLDCSNKQSSQTQVTGFSTK